MEPLGCQETTDSEVDKWSIEWGRGGCYAELTWPDTDGDRAPTTADDIDPAARTFPNATALGWDAVHSCHYQVHT